MVDLSFCQYRFLWMKRYPTHDIILESKITELGLTAQWIQSGRSLHLDKVSVAPCFFMPSNSRTFLGSDLDGPDFGSACGQ